MSKPSSKNVEWERQRLGSRRDTSQGLHEVKGEEFKTREHKKGAISGNSTLQRMVNIWGGNVNKQADEIEQGM